MQLKSDNIHNEEDRVKYEGRTFTANGLKMLESYVKTLAMVYHTSKFPLKQPIIFSCFASKR